MPWSTPPALTTTLIGSLILTAACFDNDAAQELTSDSQNAATPAVVLTCSNLDVRRGAIGDGQTAEGIAAAELSGTKDVWSDYVEFSPRTRVVCTYDLPAQTPASSILSLSLQVNYRGPEKSDMPWKFDVWNASTRKWVNVGNNGFANDWVWSATTMDIPIAPGSAVSKGKIKIRYRAASREREYSQLDQLVLLATVDSSSGSGGAGGSDNTSGSSGGTGGMGGASSSGGADGGGASSPAGIWQPAPGLTWDWQLGSNLDLSHDVDVYDVDLFTTPASVVEQMHSQGRKAICYVSAGSYEDWRPDKGAFLANPAVIGNDYSGWPGEKWLDIRRIDIIGPIMEARLDLCASKGFDGVEPDNIDAYTQGAAETGFNLTAADQLTYNKWFAAAAHARGLSVGLKNDLEQVGQLIDHFDWVLSEDCYVYDECDLMLPFVAQGKAVFVAEYTDTGMTLGQFCPDALSKQFSGILKRRDLDPWFQICK